MSKEYYFDDLVWNNIFSYLYPTLPVYEFSELEQNVWYECTNNPLFIRFVDDIKTLVYEKTKEFENNVEYDDIDSPYYYREPYVDMYTSPDELYNVPEIFNNQLCNVKVEIIENQNIEQIQTRFFDIEYYGFYYMTDDKDIHIRPDMLMELRTSPTIRQQELLNVSKNVK